MLSGLDILVTTGACVEDGSGTINGRRGGITEAAHVGDERMTLFGFLQHQRDFGSSTIGYKVCQHLEPSLGPIFFGGAHPFEVRGCRTRASIPLVDHIPEGVVSTRQIIDRYVEGTRLGLREVFMRTARFVASWATSRG